ncbi:DUF6712 family protein [Hymenobacter fodinae]|uniref:Uncharacterized protein n=1 Tax=Hymenobacter fodinae TaxID=2510796 RepID=A0A4Z0PA19_9BACT|nr:hypothetical protein [Hymenobacter fodinae]TGE08748.1 hypothetical protein EU556_13765 [Hymenobacter fodinae]
MKPKLSDFPALVAFSKSIEAGQIEPFMNDARLLDLLPLLGYGLLEQIDKLEEKPVKDWGQIVLEDTLPGTYATRHERVYRALVPKPEQDVPESPTQANPEEWVYEPLRTLWVHYLHPYWVQAGYSRFFNQHGINVVKAGITVPLDSEKNSYAPASPAQRAQVQAAIDSKAEALYSRLSVFLKSSGLLPDSTDTCSPNTRRRRRKVRGV